MGAGNAAGNHRAVLGLNGEGQEFRFSAFDHFGDAGQGAAGADADDRRVDTALGIVPDFLGRGEAVNLGIGRVYELLQHDRAGGLFDQFLGPLHGPPHAQFDRGEFCFGAQQVEHLPALIGHASRHRQDQPVSLGGADESQGNPGIARGRLDQGGSGLDKAFAFGGLDHGNPDAVLDRAQGIEKLALSQDFRLHPLVFGQFADKFAAKYPSTFGIMSSLCDYSPSAMTQKRCNQLVKRMTIITDGRATICCGDNQNVGVVGNVRETGALEVWRSALYNEWRGYHRSGQTDKIPLCKDCVFG